MLLRLSNGNLVRATLENALYILTYRQCIFTVQAAIRSGDRTKFKGENTMLIANSGSAFSIQQHDGFYHICKTSETNSRSENSEM